MFRSQLPPPITLPVTTLLRKGGIISFRGPQAPPWFLLPPNPHRAWRHHPPAWLLLWQPLRTHPYLFFLKRIVKARKKRASRTPPVRNVHTTPRRAAEKDGELFPPRSEDV